MSAPRPPRIPAPVGDVIAVVVVVVFAVSPFPDDAFRASGWMLVTALVPAAAMPFRRRLPLVVLTLSLMCATVLALTGVMSPSALIATAISAYAVVDRRGRLVGIIAVTAATVLVFFVSAIPLGGDLLDARALQFVFIIALAGALGDAARSRREFVRAMTERAERAEQGRDTEARRRVAEERVRIARDLHDVVAHQISVISLNAGVASSALEVRPERAREALTTIRRSSRTVFADIGGLMALLRSWAALRVMTPDSYPIYAQSETHPGAFVALCHSGVTLAAFHADELARSIRDGALPDFFTPFHQRRFDVPKAA